VERVKIAIGEMLRLGAGLKFSSRSLRPGLLWPILFLVLLAACGSAPETRRPEGTADNSSSERARSPEGRGDTKRFGPAHDLSVDEAQGGHTLSRHVGRSDVDLRERLDRERNISAASTYTDRATAEAVVGGVLEHNPRIQRWEDRGGRRPNLALDYHGDVSRPIGRCRQRGSSVAAPAWDAIVVLKASRDGGFYVLTSYPECPR
jgi:Bacterial CdiA-CT RNAse A domain